MDEVEDDVDEVAPLDSPSHFHNCHTHHSRLECCEDDAVNVVGVAHEDALCSPDFDCKQKSQSTKLPFKMKLYFCWIIFMRVV